MITRLALQNFKNFRDATLAFGPLTVLVGDNAAGKSNVRDALRFLHGVGRGYAFAEVLEGRTGDGGTPAWRGVRGGTYRLGFDGAPRVGLDVHLRLQPAEPAEDDASTNSSAAPEPAASEGREAVYRLAVTGEERQNLFAPFRLHTEQLAVDGETVVDVPPEGPGRLRGQRGTGDGPFVEHDFDRTKAALSQVNRAHVPPEADLDATFKQCAAVEERLNAVRFLDLDPRVLRQTGALGRSALGDRGQNLAAVLQHACREAAVKQSILDALRTLTPSDAVDLSFRVAEYAGEVTLVLEGADRTRTPAHSAAAGTLRILGMLAGLHQTPSPGLVVIDDVTAGLHPRRHAPLATVLQRQARASGTQILVTTHTAEFADALDAPAIAHRIRRPGEGPAAEVIPMGDEG